MLLNRFDGGLNTRKSPLLVQPNEAVICENVDTSEMVIKSALGKTATSISSRNKPFYFEEVSEWQDRSDALEYLEYQRKLYWTTSTRAQKYDGTTVNNLGITPPAAAPTASAYSGPLEPNAVTYNGGIVNDESTLSGAFSGVTGGGGSPASTTYTTVLFKDGQPFMKSTEVYAVAGDDFTLTITTNATTPGYTLVTYYNVSNAATYTTFAASAGISAAYTQVYGASPELVDVITDGEAVTFGIAVETSSGVVGVPVDTTATVGEGSSASEGFFLTVNYTYTEATDIVNLYRKIGGVYYFIETKTGGTSFDYFYNSQTTVLANTAVDGVVQYVYTYYNENDGTESQPSPISDEFTADNLQVEVGNLVASSDSQVTHLRIYRVGGTILSFTLVEEIVYASTYMDEITDSLLSSTLLTSTLNGVPPTGLRYIRNVFGLFVGAVDDKFYFTRDLGNPNYWPATYYIDFPDTITGIGIVASNIIVFTKYKSYVITGTNASTFVRYLLSGDQGCINHDSIVEISGQLMFLSTDGICMTTGSQVLVTSKNNLGKAEFDSINAVIHDEVYYVQLSDDRILALDLRYEPSIKYFDFSTSYLVTALDTLYGKGAGDVLHTLFTGDEVTYTYKTGRLTDGSATVLKTYKTVYVSTGSAEDSHTMKVYIDGTLIATETLTGKTMYEVILPAVSMLGYDIQFEFTGIGTVNEIEYKALGRENGK